MSKLPSLKKNSLAPKNNSQLYEVDLKKYTKCGRIKSFGFGVAYHIDEKATGKHYVAKIINCSDDAIQSNKIIDQNIKIMIRAKHPTIIKIIGYSRFNFSGDNNATIIMDLAQNGSLGNLFEKIRNSSSPNNYTDTSRQIILAGIANGMKYLHDNNILHGNLKPNNVLLDENYYPKISDFGLPITFNLVNPINQQLFRSTFPYIAPEIFVEGKYDLKADVYSFGILMFEIVTNTVAYEELYKDEENSGINLQKKVFFDQFRPEFTVPIKKSLQNLIEKCWSTNPEERPSFDEIYDKLTDVCNKESVSEKDYCIEKVDVKKFRLYIKSISDEEDSTDSKNESNQAEFEKLKAKNKKLKEENKQLKSENKEIKSKLSKSETNNKKMKSENADLKSKLESSEAASKQLKDEIEELKSQLSKSEIMNKHLKAENDELKARSSKKSQKSKNEEFDSKYGSIKLDEFNVLSMNGQYSTIENSISDFEGSSKKFIEKFIDMIKFLMTIEGIQTYNCIEIIKSGNQQYLLDVEENNEICIKSVAIDILYANDSLSNDLFISLLKKFSHVTFELKYPTNEFKGIIQKIRTIRSEHFNNDKNICSIAIILIKNASLKHIKEDAIHIKFDESFTEIQSKYLSGFKSLVTASIPSSVTAIKSNAFEGCSSLESITIPSSIKTFGSSAFKGCSSLTSVTIPSSVTSIGSSAFLGCQSLVNVIFLSSVTTIESSTFKGCTSLTNFIIPSLVTTVGSSAFEGCSSLINVTIPSSVKSIGSSAFRRCVSLSNVIIPLSITSIESSTFERCTSLTNIIIPSSVTSIGSSAFEKCSSLSSVIIPSSVTSIGSSAFEKCSALADITIPSSVTYIGKSAFSLCSALNNVEIPSSVTSIEYGLFCGCSSLVSFTINSSVTSIGKSAFYGCSAMNEITIPSSVNSLGKSAFCGCTSLTKVTILSSNVSIGDAIFEGCSSLANVTIPSSLNLNPSDLKINSNVEITEI